MAGSPHTRPCPTTGGRGLAAPEAGKGKPARGPGILPEKREKNIGVKGQYEVKEKKRKKEAMYIRKMCG